MSLKNIFLKTKITYKIYLFYNLYIRHKSYLKRRQYSQWGEDIFINNFFKNKDKGIYLDIVCYHPYMYSNTCLLYKRGWKGINVDINPTAIDLFNIARPGDTNICATIDSKKRNYKVFMDDPFSPVNTLNKNFYKTFKKSFFKNKKILNVQAKTINEIFHLNGINENVDFINIDAEGSDFKILNQININRIRPKLVSIETHNVDGKKSKDFKSISNLLKKNKYVIFKRVGPTTLFRLVKKKTRLLGRV